MNSRLITVGNIYLDHNIFGIDLAGKHNLQIGTDYFAEKGEIVLGGSAVNVAMQSLKFKMSVAFAGKVGSDESGKEVCRLLDDKNINSSLIVKSDSSTSISVNLVFKNSGEFVGAHYGTASKSMTDSDINLNHPIFNNGGSIYFGGTAKQENLFSKLPDLFSELKQKGFTIFFDPNRFPAGKEHLGRQSIADTLPYVDYYLPNDTEIMQFANTDSLDEAIKYALSKGAKNVIVKTGPKGCIVANSKVNLVIDGEKVSPITTVGAGDSFNGAFIYKVSQGTAPETAARFANKCASIKVSHNIWPSEEDIK
ncbi:carbohydrate kinase family protein [Candidatus Saccharibacteria bacterium]|nr:carbohydrate kinase family protein [Candidatus Saccharibacteria bacterium]